MSFNSYVSRHVKRKKRSPFNVKLVSDTTLCSNSNLKKFSDEKCVITRQTQHLPSKTLSDREITPINNNYTEEIIDVNEYNIFYINDRIREKLTSKISSVDEIKKELECILWIAQNTENPIEKDVAEKNIIILKKRMQDIESTMELCLYNFRTIDLIENYRKYLGLCGAKSFVNKATHQQRLYEEYMREILMQFLNIAREYIDIKGCSWSNKQMICEGCRGTKFIISNHDDMIYICANELCSREIEIADESPTYKDTDRVNMCAKYQYSKRGHFIDAMKRFQGTQNIDPNTIKRIVASIKEEMNFWGLIEERGHKNSITKDRIYDFLTTSSELSQHYDDINLLHHIITGEPCPDITCFEKELLEDFDKLEEALDEIKDPDRTNSINVNYKLYKLLQRRKYRCRKDDFYILKTSTKQTEHDDITSRAYERLGWIWDPTC